MLHATQKNNMTLISVYMKVAKPNMNHPREQIALLANLARLS